MDSAWIDQKSKIFDYAQTRQRIDQLHNTQVQSSIETVDKQINELKRCAEKFYINDTQVCCAFLSSSSITTPSSSSSATARKPFNKSLLACSAII
jgi:hypothetical protein